MLSVVAAALLANTNSFEAIHPGGETKCLRGGDYAFMVRKGTVPKIVFEFEGGGACWNAATCAVPSCTASVDASSKVSSLNRGNGIHSGSNDANPFKEYYHVFVPYCSCDVFVGNNDKRYTLNTLHHRGSVNWRAALKWAQENFPSEPEAVTVTGCSAGSAGALLNWAFIVEAYPQAKHYVFGDAFIGVLSPSQYDQGFENWNIQLPFHIPGLSPDEVRKYKPDMSCYLIEKMHAAYPNTVVSAYTSNADAVQQGFYVLGNGGLDWTSSMRGLVSCYHNNITTGKDVYTFIASGVGHCETQSNGFFNQKSEGVNLASWVSDVLEDKKPNDRVDCLNTGECSANALTSYDPSFANSTKWHV